MKEERKLELGNDLGGVNYRRAGRDFICRNLNPGAFCLCSHKLDLLEFSPLKSKKRSHLGDLARAHEILRVGAELLDPRSKLTATHAFRYVEAEPTSAVLRIVQTEFANNHLALSFPRPLFPDG